MNPEVQNGLTNGSGGFNVFRVTLWLSCILISQAILLEKPAAQEVPAANDIQVALTALEGEQSRRIGDYRIATAGFISRLYARRNYRPVWNDPANRLALMAGVSDAPSHGLSIQDFHPDVVGLTRKAVQNVSAAQRDIILSDALIRLLYQLNRGKVSPRRLDKNWNFQNQLNTTSAEQIISQALDTGTVGELIAAAQPQGPNYQRLREALQIYRQYDQQGGWPEIAAGKVLKLGMRDPRVAALRERLSITGEYRPHLGVAEPETYDEDLAEAVKRFQARHGIDVDGVLGPGTLRAMNVPAAKRVEQIRVNLERARWIARSLRGERDLVVVNIAGFYLLTVFDGKIAWWTDVVTGTPYHKTPVFTDKIRYVEFNPTWTIPPGILRRETLPKLRNNPSYLVDKGYDLIASDGRKVDSTAIDWSAMSARGFPYRVVQPPGPANSLGLVKFMFPNRHNVYLHDTPSRELFSKTGRAFSHGCVRVKDPMKFAELLLGNRNNISRAKIDSIVETGQLTRINLSKPMRVAILYWTADPVWDGGIRFYEDVYQRDGEILDALNGEFLPERAR
jgi:murein L,D-transpeptidase YcbB/YkuD